MKKTSLPVTILVLLIAVLTCSLAACNKEVGTLETLKNEYGIAVDGGGFETGSVLVSNEIVATSEEAAKVLETIADQSYNKDGSVSYAGGEASENFDNAYSAISLSTNGRVTFYDDPTDETLYTAWDIAYRYELEGEIQHEIAESYEDEYGYYPAEYWVNDPEYSYPDGVINVTGTDASSEDWE